MKKYKRAEDMNDFKNLKLYQEYPGHLCGKYPLRLYTTDFYKDSPDKVRWHVGWPKELLPDGLLLLLECDIYMFGEPWTEDDGFLIVSTMICEPVDPFPKEKINRHLDFMVRDYNKALNFCKRAAKHG